MFKNKRQNIYHWIFSETPALSCCWNETFFAISHCVFSLTQIGRCFDRRIENESGEKLKRLSFIFDTNVSIISSSNTGDKFSKTTLLRISFFFQL